MSSPSLEIPPEGLIDDLRDGQSVQVCLTPDGLDPALLDMEGDALSLLGGIGGLGEGHLAVPPPDNEFLKSRDHGPTGDAHGAQNASPVCGDGVKDSLSGPQSWWGVGSGYAGGI